MSFDKDVRRASGGIARVVRGVSHVCGAIETAVEKKDVHIQCTCCHVWGCLRRSKVVDTEENTRVVALLGIGRGQVRQRIGGWTEKIRAGHFRQ